MNKLRTDAWFCGASLVALALLAGPVFLARWIEEGSSQLGLLVTLIHPEAFGAVVLGLRLILAALGLWILLSKPRIVEVWRSVLVPVCGAATLIGLVASLWVHDVLKVDSSDRAAAREMAVIEQVILSLNPQLKVLEDAVENLEDVEPMGWQDFLSSVRYFDYAEFAVIDGELDETGTEFVSDIHFEGLARLHTSEHWASVQATQKIRWQRPDIVSDWTVEGWVQETFDVTEADNRMFSERLDAAIADPALRERLRRSLHEEKVIRAIAEPEVADPHPWFQLPSADRHTAVAVVDIDSDGDDDLYVMARWGRNMLLVNRGDGTFDEAAEAFGLDILDHSSSAVFADFDNDGDPDLFLGRTLEPSIYLLNEGHTFVDHTADLLTGLAPSLVSSVSAADYDGDGLLDLYVATFAPGMAADEGVSALVRGALLPDFLTVAHAREYHRRFFGGSMHPILNNIGPPNILLKNMGGGRLAPPAAEGPEFLYRHTYQASWADIDNDGDPDLYCANDVAENNMFRNNGDGTFEDITELSGTADVGFGMGVSFGDYDRDGRQDLYVTNMFSKAGQRITRRLNGLDPQYARMARGNSLFRNESSAFEKVSGLTPPSLLVEKAGWGWGGQFVDFDNDGFLDIYALSGYFTAPEQVAIPVDT